MQPLTTFVTALKFVNVHPPHHPDHATHLFAAIGNQLHVYHPGIQIPLATTTVLPPGVRIHGLSNPSDARIAVHGGRFVALVRTVLDATALTALHVERVREFPDCIWGTRWISPELLAIAAGHSQVYLCNPRNLHAHHRVFTDERELTWSSTLFETTDGVVRVASGTSFGDLLLSRVLSPEQLANLPASAPSESPPLYSHAHRLKGHDGPVQRLALSPDGQRLASASVDRTVRVWQTTGSICDACGPTGCFAPVLVHYGHLARVWDVAFLSSTGLAVASVAEDRTCRIWSGDVAGVTRAVLRGHAGRNVWCIAVTSDASVARVATGGEDGAVKMRSLPIADDDREPAGARGSACAVFDLPDHYRNPRGAGAARDESARALLFAREGLLVLSTDFGRLLVGELEWRGGASAAEQAAAMSWTELHRDARGTAYTPCSLALVGDVVFAGQTDGHVTVVGMRGAKGVVGNVDALRGRREMINALFASQSVGKDGCHLFVAGAGGDLHHWRVRVSDAVHAVYCATYRPHRATKGAVATSVLCAEGAGVVVVGDRAGRVRVYGLEERFAGEGEGGEGEVVRHPRAFCRPHQDRVATILLARHVGMPDGLEVVTGGFDGRVAVLGVRGACEAKGRGVNVGVQSVVRAVEHMDTIARVVLWQKAETEKMDAAADAVVVGFRGAEVVVWDVGARNEILRRNCGNWRRAFDVRVEVGGGGVQGVLLAFWRGGRLHVSAMRNGACPGDGVRTVRGGFHGQRANCAAIVRGDANGEGVVLTGGEDTHLFATYLAPHMVHVGPLRSHISGVTGVAAARTGEGFVAVSSGGGDEVVAWGAPGERGPWRELAGRRIVDVRGGGEARERVLCVATVPRGHCKCNGTGVGCLIVAVGRSDGVVAVVQASGGGGEWGLRVLALSREHRGAVLCVAGTRDADGVDEGERRVVTGDSRGDVRFWRVVGTGCDARLQQIAVWGGVHAGGVNAAAACVMGDGVVVVTGGDDEAVRATWVRRKAQEGEGDEERVSVGIGRHTAAVTGVAVTGVAGGVVVVSVGADQRVCWVGLSVVDGAIVMGAGMVLGCDVADPAAVCIDRVVEVGDEVTKVAVVVVGCGMQRLVGHV